jgi:protein-S-isoprenylcysteine O-methyltransferase Ste14
MEDVSGRRRGAVVAASLAGVVLFVALSVLGWGSAWGFVAHPARAGMLVLTFVFSFVALAAPVSLSRGVREDPRGRRVFLPAAAGTLLLCWLLPTLDRRDVLTLDGDTVRYLGLALFGIGCVLRIWPMFVLGHRFSGLVAIQPGHELETRGLYRHVRHPSYLGLLIALVGWALVFRSGVGIAAVVLGLPLLHARIASEEALLASHFGAEYDAYRRRTWRLVPGLY